MDHNSRAFARNMFRLRVHEADGQAYEDLFVRVMGYADQDFRPVRAHGRIGDQKNDGFSAKSGTYYQVYAPEEIRRAGSTAIRKLKSDFAGLKAFWDGIYAVRHYFYVVNDKYNGVAPDIESELADIVKRHGLESAAPFLARDLEHAVFSLEDDQIIAIVGHVPRIDANDFLFLSGFTYFVGAWVEFERLARPRAEQQQDKRRPLVGTRLIEELGNSGLTSSDEVAHLRKLSRVRNRLIHGDTTELPPKVDIDKLVQITERIGKTPVP